MLRFSLALALAVPLAIVSPAQAADIQTLSCVAAHVDDAVRKGLAIDIERNLATPGIKQTYAPEVVKGLQDASAACKKQYGWTDAEAEAALLYTMPVLSWPTAQRMARAKGLDPAKLERRLMALPENERIDALNETILGKLAEGALAAGELQESNAHLAGGLFGLLAMREHSLHEFKGN